MDAMVTNLARAVRKLSAAGVEHAVVSADHGHIFHPTDRDDSLRIDAPGGATLELHRRAWAGRGGATPAGCIRIAAARLDSSVSREVFEEIQSALRARSLKLLYVAPERFANERFLAQLKTLRIDLLVIDEAHCISEWGHNFRPDYLKLARYAKALNVGCVLTLTATATPAVAWDICRAFSIAPKAHVHTGF
jgi:hypothetical protein